MLKKNLINQLNYLKKLLQLQNHNLLFQLIVIYFSLQFINTYTMLFIKFIYVKIVFLM